MSNKEPKKENNPETEQERADEAKKVKEAYKNGLDDGAEVALKTYDELDSWIDKSIDILKLERMK